MSTDPQPKMTLDDIAQECGLTAADLADARAEIRDARGGLSLREARQAERAVRAAASKGTAP